MEVDTNSGWLNQFVFFTFLSLIKILPFHGKDEWKICELSYDYF